MSDCILCRVSLLYSGCPLVNRVSREVGRVCLPTVSAEWYCPYPKPGLDASAASNPP